MLDLMWISSGTYRGNKGRENVAKWRLARVFRPGFHTNDWKGGMYIPFLIEDTIDFASYKGRPQFGGR
jgi:hypothetical protein